MSLIKPKRKPKNACYACGINSDFCICSQFSKIKTKTMVSLIVHHRELKRTSNTGHLIESLLENQNVWIRGEKDKPLDHSKVLDNSYTPLLLFPSDEALVVSKKELKSLSENKPFQLLVPDGNWRQASKVHYRVSEFKDIPRITLPKGIADRESLLRKETKDEGMSTLEAIAHLLSFTESEKVKEHVLNAYALKKKTQLKLRGKL